MGRATPQLRSRLRTHLLRCPGGVTISEKSQASQDNLVTWKLQVLRPFLESPWFRSQLSESRQHLPQDPYCGGGGQVPLQCVRDVVQSRVQSRWVGLSGLSLPVGQWGLQNIEDKVRGPVPTLMMPWQVASGSPTRLVPLMDMI